MTLANPAMLWGLLALAIPIIVHLFNFRRYQKVYFSNVERLQSLRSDSRRHSEVRRWLILLARMVSIAALVLAFARPTLVSPSSQPLHAGATVVSIYVDNSFSMASAAPDGSSILDQARLKARQVASAYGSNDRFQLLTSDMTGDQFRWLGREELLQALDAMDISPASRTLDQVINRQLEFMRQSGALNRHAYIISDFQSSQFFNTPSPSDSIALITLLPLEAATTDNLYIDTLRLDAPAYFVGGNVTVEASVRNSGTHDAEAVPVKLLLGGRQRAVATLDIPARGSAKTTLHFTLDSCGWIDGTVEITDYPITFDDRYYFTLLAGQPVNMLETYDNHPNSNLHRLFEGDSAVRHIAAQLPPDLDNLHFILLGESTSLPSRQAQSLAAWVHEGGTLAIVPPANGQVDDINDLLSMLQAPKLGTWNTQPTKAASVDFSANLYRNVFSATTNEMELPTTQGHYQLNTTQAISQPIITLVDGTPLLSTTPYGSGRLYLFTTPLDAQWTDLVQQALFVPTLYNMALYSRQQPMPAHTLGSTQAISLHGRYQIDRRPPELLHDGKDPVIPEIRTVGNRSLLVPHGEVTQAGHYRLADEHLAFNYSRQESELDFYSPGEVAEAVASLPGYSSLSNSVRPLDQELRDRTAGKPLWRWCIWLALLALAIETLLIKLPWSSK